MRLRATAIVLLMLAVATATATHSDPASAGKRKKGPQTHWRYPVKGDHSYGDLENTGFGVKRPDGSTHDGQDIIANCGQPLIASHRARVQARGYADGRGYYVILDAKGSKLSFAYDHMKGPGGPGKGHPVKVGRRIGYVGNTEVSTGVCHLHFEVWKGGWERGYLVNPLRYLRHWEKYSKGDLVDEEELMVPSHLIAPSAAIAAGE